MSDSSVILAPDIPSSVLKNLSFILFTAFPSEFRIVQIKQYPDLQGLD